MKTFLLFLFKGVQHAIRPWGRLIFLHIFSMLASFLLDETTKLNLMFVFAHLRLDFNISYYVLTQITIEVKPNPYPNITTFHTLTLTRSSEIIFCSFCPQDLVPIGNPYLIKVSGFNRKQENTLTAVQM